MNIRRAASGKKIEIQGSTISEAKKSLSIVLQQPANAFRAYYSAMVQAHQTPAYTALIDRIFSRGYMLIYSQFRPFNTPSREFGISECVSSTKQSYL